MPHRGYRFVINVLKNQFVPRRGITFVASEYLCFNQIEQSVS